ncbi:hypothetical protein [Litoreibacter roseus]|nr:hypothetical protein [Litoreibacter roseus]
MLDELSFTLVSAAYLLWYGWRVFVTDKGNPGALGLTVSVLAFGQICAWLAS